MKSDVVVKLKSIVGLRGFSEDPAEIAPYVEEWRSKYKGHTPLLLKPSTTAQVSAILALCNETKTPVVPQGGNTGLVGGQIPLEGEVLLSLSKLNKVRAFDAEDASITADAGVILEVAQDMAEENGYILPLSMGSKGSATLGGMVSTNAGGVNVVRYDMTRAQVLGLEVVLANGQVVDALRTLRKDNTGYDLKQLFVGAEGTLGVITGVALKLCPRPPERSTAFLAVNDLDAAFSLLSRLQAETGSMLDAFEVFPREILNLVLKHIPGTQDPLAEASPWYVLCAFSGPVGIKNNIESVLGDAISDGLVTDAAIAAGDAQRRALWRLRESISEAEKKEGPSLKHDVSVPVRSVPEFVARGMAAFAAAAPDLKPVPYGHLGDGNIHFNLVPGDGCDTSKVLGRGGDISRIVYDVVREFGGSISAEHGIGVMKRAELKLHKSDAEMRLMRTIKKTLDPNNILNPGKMLSVEDESA